MFTLLTKCVCIMLTFRIDMRKCLTIYSFLMRAHYQEDNVYEDIKRDLEDRNLNMEKLHRLYYLLFESGFCTRDKERCTMNIHTFYHLHHARERMGPLWKTSAEPFESAYSILRRLYRPGTRNTAKQVLENFYLKAK